MKTFIKYPGGKTKELPLVQRYLPNGITRYFEPFVGGGAVYFGLDIHDNYINDFSDDLMSLYKLLQDRNKALKEVLMILNNLWKKTGSDKMKEDEMPEFFSYEKYLLFLKQAKKRKENTVSKFAENNVIISKEDMNKIAVTANKTAVYMLIRDLYNSSKKEIEHIAGYYFMREFCYSSMFRFSKDGMFNVPYGGMSYNDKNLDEKIKYMFSDSFNKKLKCTSIYNLDFEEFINNFDYQGTDFMFLDPPYDSDFSTYDQNAFDKNEQIRLQRTLSRVSAKWMLIIKKTDFISDLYKDFFVYEYDKNYTVSFKNRNEKGVKHLMITNYDINEVAK